MKNIDRRIHARSVTLLALLLLGAQAVLAAPPRPTLALQKTWGGTDFDLGAGVAVASDGSIYLAGSTASFGAGGEDIFLVKYATDGTLIWQRTFGTGAAEFASAVAVGPDGSVYVAGTSADTHALLVKFSPDGTLIWQESWGGTNTEFANGVAVASDGSIYLTGFTTSFGVGFDNAFLVKFAPDGSLIWQRTWGGSNSEFGNGLALGSDGSIYVAGEASSFQGNDAFLLKFTLDGTLVWQRDWNGGGAQNLSAGQGVAVGADGSVYLTGPTRISGVGQNTFLAKFAPDGSLIWDTTWGDNVDAALAVAVGPDGSIFVTGNTGFGSGGGDLFVVQFLPSGKAKQAMTWGGVNNDTGASIVVGTDGSVYVAGSTGGPPYAFARAPKMTKTPRSILSTPAGTVTAPAGTVANPNGIVMTPNGSQTFAGGEDAALLKIIP
jgi:uncharacterized delta-60 repeat protein